MDPNAFTVFRAPSNFIAETMEFTDVKQEIDEELFEEQPLKKSGFLVSKNESAIEIDDQLDTNEIAEYKFVIDSCKVIDEDNFIINVIENEKHLEASELFCIKRKPEDSSDILFSNQNKHNSLGNCRKRKCIRPEIDTNIIQNRKMLSTRVEKNGINYDTSCMEEKINENGATHVSFNDLFSYLEILNKNNEKFLILQQKLISYSETY